MRLPVTGGIRAISSAATERPIAFLEWCDIKAHTERAKTIIISVIENLIRI